MTDLRFAVLGTGFWSQYQIAAWGEIGGVNPAAVYNRTRQRAEQAARRFGIPKVYDDPEELLKQEQGSLDFVDIIAAVETHAPLVRLAAEYGLPVICQTPMSTDLQSAEGMLAACHAAGVPLYMHENWRWQAPIRGLKAALDSGIIGAPFRARIDMISGFPVFDHRPAMKDREQFIISDLGSHTLDTARFLFGEAASLYCQSRRVRKDIRGEDVATILLEMQRGPLVTVNMAYAGTPLEREYFPQTLIFIEGEAGSLEIRPDYWLHVTTREGMLSRRLPPPRYAWADPAFEVMHASIVPCYADLLAGIKGQRQAETTGEDNLRTARLVFAAYESAAAKKIIHF